MTIREGINKQKRTATIVAYAGFTLCALGAILGAGQVLAFLPGFAIFGGAVFYGLSIRCPICHGAIGFLVSHSGTPFSVSRKIQYCPYCGVTLDSELDDKREDI
jgi:hypothetical protein